jgi:hypothetical protein
VPETAPQSDARPVIPTHDRRLRVFVSSTLEELAPERRAVRDVVTGLRLTPVLFELGVTVWPLLQSLATQLDEQVRTALGPEDDRRERAAGAVAGPWTALDEGLAAVSHAG